MILKRNSKQMTICIKSLIKNMNIVVGCSIGCSYNIQTNEKQSATRLYIPYEMSGQDQFLYR